MLYTLNLYNVVCQLHLNKIREEKAIQALSLLLWALSSGSLPALKGHIPCISAMTQPGAVVAGPWGLRTLSWVCSGAAWEEGQGCRPPSQSSSLGKDTLSWRGQGCATETLEPAG